jgi:cardiolipin synthase
MGARPQPVLRARHEMSGPKGKHWLIIAAGVLAFLGFVWMRARPSMRHSFEHVAAVDNPQFTRALEGLLGAPLKDGNDLRELSNGDEIFPAMLEAIHAARRTISFESYIYWSGRVGDAFADALCERARAGVKVYVLMDWMGAHKADETRSSG